MTRRGKPHPTKQPRPAAAGCRLGALVVMLGAISLCAGCLNPEFLNANVGNLYPIAPGDEPFVLVRIINDTTATLDIPVLWDDGTNVQTYNLTGLSPEVRDTGVLVNWPVTRVALGDIDNPWLANITASFEDGSVSGIPFGQQALRRTVDFDRGDAIIFSFNEDSRNPVYIRVSVGIIDGDAQPTTYTRADPFEAVRLVLALSGF